MVESVAVTLIRRALNYYDLDLTFGVCTRAMVMAVVGVTIQRKTSDELVEIGCRLVSAFSSRDFRTAFY